MVQMTPEDQRKFPNLARFLEQRIGQIPLKDPDLFSTFRKHIEFGRTMKPPYGQHYGRVLSALLLFWGFGPKLLIRDLGERYGHFNPHHPHFIQFSDRIAGLLEKHPNSDAGRELVEAKILHELVHYADYWNDLSQHTRREVGNDFEREAFGQVIQLGDSEW